MPLGLIDIDLDIQYILLDSVKYWYLGEMLTIAMHSQLWKLSKNSQEFINSQPKVAYSLQPPTLLWQLRIYVMV